MSTNTTVQHTCKIDADGIEATLERAPFKSIKRKKKDVLLNYSGDGDWLPFVGVGYYYWDYNPEQAEIMGIAKYLKKGIDFVIIEAETELNDDNCLDLVGNRRHMKFITDTMKELRENNFPNCEEIAHVLEYLKVMSTYKKSAFPYEIVKYVETTEEDIKNSENRSYFVGSTAHFTNFNPRIAVCFITEEALPLRPHTILSIHERKNLDDE